MMSKEKWIERVSANGEELSKAPVALLSDEDVVCAAVKKNYLAFQYASPLLQNDKKFFMEKLIPLSEDSPYALAYASSELQKDKEVVKEAVHYDYLSFQFANSELKDDRDFVKELVQLKKIRSGLPPAYALRYASKRVQNDKEVVLAAVKSNGFALQFASDELRNDKEVVREAIRNYGMYFQYASEELRNDREFCLECVKINGSAFEHVSDNLKEEYGKTKDEFMKNKSEHNPISESMKNEGKKMEIDTMESVVRAEEEPRAVSMPKSLLKKIGKNNDRTTVTESTVRAEEPDRISMSDSKLETKEYQKQIEELKKALYRGEKERKALRVELENREKLTEKMEVRLEKEVEKSRVEKEKLIFEKKELSQALSSKEKVLESERLEKDEMARQMEVLLFERSLVGKTFKSYTQIKPIGGRGLSKKLDGSMSVVYHVKHKGRDLAMKIMLNLDDRSSLTLQNVFLGSEFLDRLPIHPSLLRIHNCFVGTVDGSDLRGWDFDESYVRNKTAFFIMPLCDGNLKTKVELAGNRRPIFNDEKFVSFLKQIVNGLEVMKAHNFIHRDIKQDNLLEKDGKYLICDFGMCFDAKRYRGFKIPFVFPQGRGGSPFYMPPEIRDRDDFGEPDAVLCFDKYDVYSLGIVSFELFSRRKFFFGIKLKKEECKNEKIRRTINGMIEPYEKRFSVEELHKKVSEL